MTAIFYLLQRRWFLGASSCLQRWGSNSPKFSMPEGWQDVSERGSESHLPWGAHTSMRTAHSEACDFTHSIQMSIRSAQATPQQHWWDGQHHGAAALWGEAAWWRARWHRHFRRADRHISHVGEQDQKSSGCPQATPRWRSGQRQHQTMLPQWSTSRCGRVGRSRDHVTMSPSTTPAG